MIDLNPFKSKPNPPSVTMEARHLTMTPEEKSMQPHPYLDAAGSEEPLNTSSPETEPTHFDDLLGGPDAPPEDSGSAQGGGELTETEFIEMYAELFGFAAAGTGIQALEITPEDERALAAMYRRAKASRWLRWMLTPGGPEVMDWFLIARFAAVKGRAVASEMHKKKNVGNSGEKMNFSKAKAATANAPRGDGYPDADQRAALTGR